MNKTPKTLKGFRDFLPEEKRKRQWLEKQLIQTFESWGYQPLETPTLEPLELFDGEIGEDEKLFFKFKDLGGRDVALRYDQTVPTCRVIGLNAGNLNLPFRRYQIQSNFRAEKPQKGRFREFVQADIDIFGIKSPLADAEAIALSLDVYRRLGVKQIKVLINNRDLMKNVPYEAIAAIDKLEKIGSEGVIADMVKKGISQKKAQEYFDSVKNLKPDETVQTIFDYLKNYGFKQENFQFQPTLARSFSYSQGPIWEMVIPDYSAGSVGGGERYDSMLKRITGRNIPATGIAFGFDRTLEALEELKLLPDFPTLTQVLVTALSAKYFRQGLKIAQKLRDSGINTQTYPDPTIDFRKQLKFANKESIPFVVIIGEQEVSENKLSLKNMDTGDQQLLTLKEAILQIKKA